MPRTGLQPRPDSGNSALKLFLDGTKFSHFGICLDYMSPPSLQQHWESGLWFWCPAVKPLTVDASEIQTEQTFTSPIEKSAMKTRKWCEISSKLRIKASERRRSAVFIVNFGHISHLLLVLFCWLLADECFQGIHGTYQPLVIVQDSSTCTMCHILVVIK